jgi:hypothetical protein
VCGHYTVGKEIVGLTLDGIRKLGNECIAKQGFVTFHSFGGCTGVGFGSLLLERPLVDSSKKSKLKFTVHRAPQVSAAVIEPDSFILGTHAMIHHSDSAFLINSESYHLCRRALTLIARRTRI